MRPYSDRLSKRYGAYSLTRLLSLTNLAAIIFIQHFCVSAYASTVIDAGTPLTRLIPSEIENELSQKSILSIFQSSNGDLWLATFDGLSRYDGSKIVNYRPSTNGLNHIDSIRISEILEGKLGQIYVATRDRGLFEYNNSSDSFTSVQLPFSGGAQSRDIRTAIHSSTGTIWLSVSDGRILRLWLDQPSILHYTLEEREIATDFFEDIHGSLWFSTSTGRLYVIESDADAPKPIPEVDKCFEGETEILDIAIQGPKHIWLGTSGSGLFRLDMEGINCQKYSPLVKGQRLLENATVHEIFYEAYTRDIWVASDEGLFQIGSKGLRYYDSNNSNLLDNEVTALAPGFRDSMWVGTYTGLSISAKTKFHQYGPMSDPHLSSIVAIDGRSKKKDVWIASYDGIHIYNRKTGSHKALSEAHGKMELTNDRIMSLSITDDDVWIGYRSTGLEHYSFRKEQLTKYGVKSKNKLSSNAVSAILSLPDQQTLVGTYGGGLNLLKPDDSTEIMRADGDIGSLGNDNVIFLYQGSQGHIWVGTESGLQFLEIESKRFIPLSSLIVNAVWPQDRIVFSIKESTNGSLWLGTMHSGLFRLSPNRNKPEKFDLTAVTLKHTTPIKTVYSVEIDDRQDVWVSTSSGITRVDHSSLETTNYSRGNGLIETAFDFGASYKDADGNLYFGGSNGYNRFNPADIDIATPPPPVVLTGLEIAGHEPRLPAPLRDLDLIELNHEDYFVRFIFAALDFIEPGKNAFSYKLENFDPQWIDNENRNGATYTNLPPGDYTFRVRGSNSAGVWNMEGASIGVKVYPPWWETWWAFCTYFLLAMIPIHFAFKYYEKNRVLKLAKAEAAAMAAAADRANDDLQEQLEIQDSLVKSSYLHNVNLLMRMRDLYGIQADFVEDDAARETIENSQRRLLALSHLEGCMFYQGDMLYADMHRFTELIISMILPRCSVPAESLTTINDVVQKLVPINVAVPIALIMYELLDNCVQHAFDVNSPANYIQVHLREANCSSSPGQKLLFTVKDSGLGIPSSLCKAGPDSTGLTIVHSLVAQMGGHLDIATDQGTIIEIVIPETPPLLIPYGSTPRFDA